MKVQAVRGHPRASVGVLLGPRGVDESQAGVPRADGVEEVDQSVAPPGLVGGLLLAPAIVKVFIGATLVLTRYCGLQASGAPTWVAAAAAAWRRAVVFVSWLGGEGVVVLMCPPDGVASLGVAVRGSGLGLVDG